MFREIKINKSTQKSWGALKNCQSQMSKFRHCRYKTTRCSKRKDITYYANKQNQMLRPYNHNDGQQQIEKTNFQPARLHE